jgi:hypothetical protein
MTYKEIALRLGVHHSRVQQLEKRALKKLSRNARLRTLYEDFVLKDERRSNYLGTLFPDEMGEESISR